MTPTDPTRKASVTDQLPPVPDASGNPRPPAAPAVSGPWDGTREVVAHHHPPASGDDIARTIGYPLLERAVSRRPNRLRHALAGAAAAGLVSIVVAVVVLLVWSEDRAGDAVIFGGVFAVVLGVFAVLFFLTETHLAVEAGPRGVAMVDGAGEGTVVDVYRLTRISLVDWGPGPGPALRVVGPGRTVQVLPCGLVEGNQQLWDLVHNGLRHSAAAGAEVDDATRERLHLPPAT